MTHQLDYTIKLFPTYLIIPLLTRLYPSRLYIPILHPLVLSPLVYPWKEVIVALSSPYALRGIVSQETRYNY